MKKIKILNVLILAITLNFGLFVADATAKDENKQKVEEVKTTEKTESENKSEGKVEEKKEQETQGKNAGNNVKNNEKEEKAKIEEEKRKEIEKNIKEHEEIEKAEIEKNKKKYENFKKEDYEVEGFNLEVYWKNGVPYLYYVHKKTKAQIVFVLVEEEDFKRLPFLDSSFFKASLSSDSGLAHFAEHFLTNFMNYFDDKYGKEYQFQAVTIPTGLALFCSSNFPENDLFFNKLYENLTDEVLLKDEKAFEIEKKRIIDEMRMKSIDSTQDKMRRDFVCGGTVESLKKVNFKEFRSFYEKYIHPSNMIITKHVKLNKKNIIGFLKELENNYLNKFEFKNVKSNFKLKCNDKFRKIKIPAENEIFKTYEGKKKKKKIVKYSCCVTYDLDELNLNLEQQESFDVAFNEKTNLKLEKFVKKLGYDVCGCFYGRGYVETGKLYYDVILKANDKNLFKKDVLKRNINKILEFLKNELSNVKEDKIQNLKSGFKYQEVPAKDQEYLAAKLPKSHIYGGNFDVGVLLNLSFAKYNEPFSPKVFYIDKNNEIIDSKENFVAKTKNNLNSYDILINSDPSYVDFFEGDEDEKEEKEEKKEKNKEYKNYLLPIKIKEHKNNKMVYMVANDFIRSRLGHLLSFKKGYCYSDSIGRDSYFLGDYIGSFIEINKESKNKIFKFLKEDFGKFIKNLKFTRKDFNRIINKRKEKYSEKAFEEELTREKRYLKYVKDWLKAVDKFCETGETDVKLFNKFSLVKDVMDATSNLACNLINIDNKYLYNNYEEYFKNELSDYKEQAIFIKNELKQRNEKISKESLKQIKKHVLENLYILSKHRIKCLKENKKLIETVKYEDVLKAIKSTYYCEDDKFNEYLELLNKIKKYEDKITKYIEKM